MAWIAVHEQINGSKLREFRKKVDCSKCEAVGILVTLWLWGINNADPTGEIRAADREDIADMLQNDISRKKSAMAVVEALISTGWIDEIDGTLYIHDWGEWQEQWYKALARREKDRQRKREGNASDTPTGFRGTSSENPQDFHGKSAETPQEYPENIQRDSSATVTVTTPSPIPTQNQKGDIPPLPPVGDASASSQEEEGQKVPKPKRRNPSTLQKTQEARFNRFWAVYPRKESIGNAEKAWAKINPDDALTERIIEAVETATTKDNRFRERRYTPHPATWLNGREWENQFGDEQGEQKGKEAQLHASAKREYSGAGFKKSL